MKPGLQSAEAITSKTIELTFSKELDKESASTIVNYTFSPKVSVEKAELKEGDNKTVVITLKDATPLYSLTKYTVTVADLKDTAGNAIETATAEFQGTAAIETKFAGIYFESTTTTNLYKDGAVYAAAPTQNSDDIYVVLSHQNASLLDTSKVKLYNETKENYVPIAPDSITTSIDGKSGTPVIIIDPTANLDNNSVYRIEIQDIKVWNDENSQVDIEPITAKFAVGTPTAVAINPGLTGELPTTVLDTDDKNLLTAGVSVAAFNGESATSETVRLYKVNAPEENAAYKYDAKTGKVIDESTEEAVETTLVDGEVNYNSSRRTIEFVPATELDEKSYYVFVIDGVTSAVGITSDLQQRSFMTGEKVSANLLNVVSYNNVTKKVVDVLTAGTDLSDDPSAASNSVLGTNDFLLNFDKAVVDPTTLDDVLVEVYNVTDDVYEIINFGTDSTLTLDSSSVIEGINAEAVTNGQLKLALKDVLKPGREYKVTIEGLKTDNANKTAFATEFSFKTDAQGLAIAGLLQLPADATATTLDATAVGKLKEIKSGATNLVTDTIDSNLDGSLVVKFNRELNGDQIDEIEANTTGAATELVTVYDVTNSKDITENVTLAVETIGGVDYLVIDDSQFLDGTKYQITLSADLEPVTGGSALGKATTYTFSVGNDVKVENSNVEFNPTGTAPNVWDTAENLDASTDKLKVDSSVRVTFDLNNNGTDNVGLKRATVNANTVYLKEVITGEKVAASLSVTGAENNVVVIKPSANLKENTAYELVVDGVTDLADNKASYAAAGKVFVTELKTAVTPNIEAGSTVAYNDKLTFTFSKPLGTVTGKKSTDTVTATADTAVQVQLVELDADGNPVTSADIDLASAVTKNPGTNQVVLDLAQLKSELNAGNDLKAGKSYKVVLTTGTDLAITGDQYAFTFKTPVDTKAPVITSYTVNPYNTDGGAAGTVGDSDDYIIESGAVGIENDGQLVVNFDSKDLKDATLKLNVFNATDNTVVTTTPVDVNLTADKKYAVIDLTGLDADKKYIFTFSGGEDINGNKVASSTITLTLDDAGQAFAELATATLTTTNAVSGGAAAVTSDIKAALNTVKGENAYKATVTAPVAVNTDGIALGFNGVVNTAGYQLTFKDAEGNTVAASSTWDATYENLVIKPTANLKPRTTYTVTVSGLKDLGGNTTETRTIVFTTEGYLTATTSIADQANNVTTSQALQVTFGNDIVQAAKTDNATLKAANIKVTNVTDGKEVTLTDANLTVTGTKQLNILPLGGWTAGKVYKVEISNEIKDLTGNPLQKPIEVNFFVPAGA